MNVPPITLRLPAPSPLAWVAVGLVVWMAHESAEGNGVTPADFPGLVEASTAPVGTVRQMRKVLPSGVAFALGTGPLPIFAEGWVKA